MDLAEIDSYGQYAEAFVSLVREGTLGCLLSRLARRLLCLAGDVSAFKVLDAGGGEGQVARRFARNEPASWGVEIAPLGQRR